MWNVSEKDCPLKAMLLFCPKLSDDFLVFARFWLNVLNFAVLGGFLMFRKGTWFGFG